jgi:hypothetical protein
LNNKRIPYINLLPVYANSEQLGNEPDIPWWQTNLLPWTTYSDESFDRYRRHIADYISTVDTDYISVDVYPYNVDGTRDDWLHNLDILSEACRDTDRDLWVITQAAGNEIHGGEGNYDKRHCDKKADQLQQGYASLAFGAKAIIYACYQTGWWDAESHMIDPAGNTTPTYDAVQAANAELALFAEKYGEYRWLGAYTVNSHKMVGLRYELSNGLPKSEKLSVNSKDGILVGCFEQKQGGGKAYVVVNMSEVLDDKAVSCSIDFPKGSTVTVYELSGNKVYANCNKALKLTLAPGDGRFITVD